MVHIMETIDIAALSDVAVGLNINEMISGFDVDSSEARDQLMWSIVRFEGLLSIMSGKASSLGNASCSASPLHLASVLNYEELDFDQSIKNLRWTTHLGKGQTNSQKTFFEASSPSSCL